MSLTRPKALQWKGNQSTDGRYVVYKGAIRGGGTEWRLGFRDDSWTTHRPIGIAINKESAKVQAQAHADSRIRKPKQTKFVNKHKARTRGRGTIGFKEGHVNLAIAALTGHAFVIQDAWIRFEEGVLLRDGDYYRVVENDGTRYRGAKHPRKAIEFWKAGNRAPDEQPARHQLWVSKKQPNSGLEITSYKEHGHPRDGGPFVTARVVLFDTARKKWTPIYEKGKPQRVVARRETLERRYRREFDPTRSSE